MSPAQLERHEDLSSRVVGLQGAKPIPIEDFRQAVERLCRRRGLAQLPTARDQVTVREDQGKGLGPHGTGTPSPRSVSRTDCGRRRVRGWIARLLVVSALVPGVVDAQVYRWVDDEGVIHYSTEIESMPEPYRPAARPLPVTPAPPPRPSGPPAHPPLARPSCPSRPARRSSSGRGSTAPVP
jgi:Domain of unknown function (DUF4124)